MVWCEKFLQKFVIAKPVVKIIDSGDISPNNKVAKRNRALLDSGHILLEINGTHVQTPFCVIRPYSLF